MKTYRGIEEYVSAFKPWVLDEGDWSVSCLGLFIRRESESPVTVGQETDRSLGYIKKGVLLLKCRWLQQVSPKR
jgi:hypothetical protein